MLTIQYIPYTEIETLSSNERVNKLFNVVRENKIILLQGRLEPNEEIKLVQKTMENINKKFKGIELCTIFPQNKDNNVLIQKLKSNFISMILGNREGVTIIGPASIVKEIKRDPEKIQLFTKTPRRQ